MKLLILFTGGVCRGVINEVQCGFFWIYAPTPYSTVFLLHVSAPAPAPTPIKIGFGAVWCGAV
jgi:hypothetical protein